MRNPALEQSKADNEGSRQTPARQRRWPWLFLCTAVAILIIVTALGLVLLPRIEKAVSARHGESPERLARLISALTLERLIAADQSVQLVAERVERHETSAATSTLDSVLTPFSNVAVLEADNTTVALKGNAPTLAPLGAETVAHVAEGRTSLVTARTDSGTRLVLVRAVNSADNAQAGLLVAELAPGYLWRSIGVENEHTPVCILNSGGEPILCAPSSADRSVSPTVASGTGSNPSVWRRPFVREELSGISPLTIEQTFGIRGWTVSVTEMRPAPLFRELAKLIYILGGVLAVFVSGALATWLTRHRKSPVISSAPVQRADSGTHVNVPAKTSKQKTGGVTRNNKVDTDDRKLTTLALLSEIDRAILSGATFERIIDSVFERIGSILPGDTAALALLDREKPSRCKMIIVSRAGERQICRIEEALDARSTAELELITDGDWFDTSPDDALLAPLHQLGMKRCLLFPVFKDGVPAGALIVAIEDTRSLADQDYSLARDMAHRLGVAYTSAARGQELLFHSLYDATTELPNRKFFENRLEEEISRARRESRLLALLLVDLDNFKKINDTYGHEGGDMLLEQASARLKACLRSEDLVARVGSDEFGVLLPTISQDKDATNVAEKLIETLSDPYSLGSQQQHLSATIGIAVFPRDGQTSRAMLQSADFALHAAKQEGGAKYSAFEPQSNEQAQDQAALANDLRHAITKSELKLYFQPQIDLQRGEIVGAEALVRWQHRTRGMVMPGAFINIAEQSDLIEQVGEFVRHTASAQFREWEKAGLAPMRVSVNVSSREVKHKDFVERIENTLITSGLRPFSLELEITESLLLENAEDVLTTLKALSDRGVRIAIDDFGTGYSSMAYLKNLPFHVLKIDRSFVKDIGTADGSDSIVTAIIGVAQSLGKEIVAEGIEFESQRAFLKENGCDMGQGYLWSRPVPADEFASFVRNWNNTARRVAAVD